MSSTRTFSRIRAAAIDERLLNPYLRREQLENLHTAIQSNSQELCDAAFQDACVTKAETKVEIHLALLVLKEHYVAIDPDKELKAEYQLAHGQDFETRRKPYGIVYIEPCLHTLTFSVIVAVGAAIAAGNCVLVQFDNSLRSLPRRLKEILTQALDNDIFATTSSRPGEGFEKDCLQVLQRGAPVLNRSDQLVSAASERTVAVVDRTADINEAARALVSARFAFDGKSPYAPDVVLVNEFVEKAFLEAAVRHSINFISKVDASANGSPKQDPPSSEEARRLVQQITKQGAGSIVSSGQKGTIASIRNRNFEPLSEKNGHNILLVHTVTSIDDAITLANKNGTLAATYVFSNQPSVKYLSQFIDARAAFANHIPFHLLVGPMAPVNRPVSSVMRYDPNDFSTARPQFILPPLDSATIADILGGANAAALGKLGTAAKLPPAKKRPDGTGIGFFEQGILVGASLYFPLLLAGLGAGMFFGYRVVAAKLLS